MKRLMIVFVLTAITASTGCGWFSREKPAVTPAELTDIIGARVSSVNWSRDTGSGLDDLHMKLEATLSGSTLYVADADGLVTAIDSTSGSSLWSADVDLPLRGGPGAGEGLVVVGSRNGDLVALESGSGSERWRTTLDSDIPAVPLIASGVVVAHTNNGKLVGVNAATGERIWTFHRSAPSLGLRGAGEAVADGNTLYAGLDGGKLVKLDIATGRPAWETPIAYPSGRTELDRVVDIDSRPLVSDRVVYTVSFQGQMAAVDKARGSVNWSRSLSSHQGLVSDGATLYAADSNGGVVAVDAANGGLKWRQDVLKGRQLSAPALAGGYLAVADLDGYVHWLSPDNGSLVARVRAVSSAVQAPLVAVGNRVIAYGIEGQLASVTAP